MNEQWAEVGKVDDAQVMLGKMGESGMGRRKWKE